MSVDHQQKYLHSIKIKEAASAANVKAGQRRRRLLLTREVSNLSNASIEAGYHAQEPAAVPFVWESSPGTPKRHAIMRSSCHEIDREILLPPLTPPPSYHQQQSEAGTTRSRPSFSSSKKKKQNDANVNLIQSMFPRLSFKKDQTPALSSSASTKSSSPTSTSSSTSSSSSPSSQARSVMSTPSPTHKHRLSFKYSRTEVEEEEEVGSPVSTLCFHRLSCCNRRFRGLYSRWL